MNIYLSGPMSGIPNFNIPKFNLAAESLRSSGFGVINPPEQDPPELRNMCEESPDGKVDDSTWGECIGRDISFISSSSLDAICLLKGWGDSWGSTMELIAAIKTGLKVYMFCPPEDRDEVFGILDDKDDTELLIELDDGHFLLEMPVNFRPSMVANAVASLTAEALAMQVLTNPNPEVIH